MTQRDPSNCERWAQVDDTVWPIYSGDVEWALRYGGEGLLSRTDKLYLASVLSAYDHLTRPDARQRTVAASLRRARLARSR